MNGPTVGRVVHLVADDGACLAAIVTKVPEAEAGDAAPVLLTVFAPSGPTMFSAPFDGDKATSTWHWPERDRC